MLLNSLVRCFRGFQSPSAEPVSPCFEPMEARIVLAGSPFPNTDIDLIEPNNTVVRIETNLGDIDIELFDVGGPGGSTAPTTVANFLQYITDGDWDESFMHRLVGGFVVQMGGFKFDDAGGVSNVPTDGPLVNEFSVSRSNIERTVAMAKLGGDPNSATSQFFFNLADNSANLDNVNGGFTVFGRIATDASWTVVTNIGALGTADYSSTNFALTDTPVVTSGQPISESVLVTLIDIEVIKPKSISASDDRLYTEVLAYPEGYRADTVTETVEIVNPGATDAAYQIIVRYERGVRDQVITTGTLGANEHRVISISDFADPDSALVRGNVPYAIEIHSTGVFGASFTHTDFGATTHESFYNIRTGNEDVLSLFERRNWALGGTGAVGTSSIDPNITRLPFLTFLNDSDTFALVTVTFKPQSSEAPVTITTSIEPYRRSGIEVFSIAGVTGALAGIEVNSTQSIVAALSVYEQHTSAGAAPVITDYAYTSQMTSGAGATAGVLAGIQTSASGDNFLSIYNNSSTVAVVSFQFIKDSGTVLRSVVVSPDSRVQIDITSSVSPADGMVTLRYSSGSTPVNVQYVSTQGDDIVSTTVANRVSGFTTFTGGSYNAEVGGSEIISVYNPHTAASVVKQLVVRYYFSDGTATTLPFGAIQLDSGERLDLDISDLSDTQFDAVRAKIASDPAFSTYSISILATIISSPGGVFPTSVAVSMSQAHGTHNSSVTGGVPLPGPNHVLVSDPALNGNSSSSS